MAALFALLDEPAWARSRWGWRPGLAGLVWLAFAAERRAAPVGRAASRRRRSARPPPTTSARPREGGASRKARARGAADRHAGRPRQLDARHHQGDPRVAGAGRRVRRARAARAPPAPAPTSSTPATSRRWRPAPTSAPRRRSRSACRRHAATDEPDARRTRRRGASRRRRQRRRRDDAQAGPRAAAYIRGLAQLRGRNAEWAERAVREAVSLSADEALAQNVIDFVARDVADLLRQARRPQGDDPRRRGDVLADAGARRRCTIEPDWRTVARGHHRPERRADPDDDRHLRADLRVHRTRASCCPASSARSACCSRCSRCRCCRSTTRGSR